MATYDLTQTTPIKLQTGDIINVPYSGTYKAITLPKGVYKLEVWGAQGGSYSSYYGGKGGYSYGTLTLEEDTTLNCYAGGQPATNSSSRVATSGGYNGGGNGFNRYYSSTYTYGQGGGGGSDIRINSTSLYARVIVAGGGGGSASVDAQTTKYGGGTSGGSPQSGYGASQTGAGTNGSFGTGGAATTSGNNYKYGSGGGGGGWYGGGACTEYSDSTNYRGYNGGGSGYVYTSSTASNYPSGCLLTSAYYLTDATTVAGNTSFTDYSGSTVTGHSGNGYVRITVIEIKKDLKVKTKVEYTELSYIESTGTQYIDTNFYPSGNTLRVKMKFKYTSSHASLSLFGNHNTTPYSITPYGAKPVFYVGNTNSISCGNQTSLNTAYELDVTADNGTLTAVWNGVTYTASYSGSLYTALSVFIFGSNSGSGVVETGDGYQLEYIQFYDNGTIVRDYIPVLDNNNVVCLFDKVNSEFVYNAGTGSFTAGEIIQKVTTSVWKDGQECYVKANDNTWKVAQSVYVKTIDGWKQVI